jgi:hypothetical protein
MQTVHIMFLGLCLITNLSVGYQDGKRIILPNLKGTTPPHTAFIAFPEKAIDSGGPAPRRPFPRGLVAEQEWVWLPLNGDEVFISTSSAPFTVDKSYAVGIDRLRDHCPQFGALAFEYAVGTDQGEKAAQIDLAHGTLFLQTLPDGMKASRLEVQAAGPFVITLVNWQSGETRRITVPVTPTADPDRIDVVIGNLRSQLFEKPLGPKRAGEGYDDHSDFLAYYEMATAPTGCTWSPGEQAASALHPPQAARVNKDAGGRQEMNVFNFGPSCSNTNFP